MTRGCEVVVATTEFSPFRGGLASYSESLAAGLRAAGHAVRVLAPAYASSTVGSCAIEDIVRRYPLLSRRAPLRRRWLLARALMEVTKGSDGVVVLAATYLYA